MISEHAVNLHASRQLRSLRATTGLSQAKLGNKVSVSYQQIQKYEWAISAMTVGRVAQFAEAFDVSPLIFFPTMKPGTYQPMPPPTLRFIRLINTIEPAHYDLVFDALKAISKLTQRPHAKR